MEVLGLLSIVSHMGSKAEKNTLDLEESPEREKVLEDWKRAVAEGEQEFPFNAPAAIEEAERARRRRLHAQIGALYSQLNYWSWFTDRRARERAGKLRNKILRLEGRLAQAELKLGL